MHQCGYAMHQYQRNSFFRSTSEVNIWQKARSGCLNAHIRLCFCHIWNVFSFTPILWGEKCRVTGATGRVVSIFIDLLVSIFIDLLRRWHKRNDLLLGFSWNLCKQEDWVLLGLHFSANRQWKRCDGHEDINWSMMPCWIVFVFWVLAVPAVKGKLAYHCQSNSTAVSKIEIEERNKNNIFMRLRTY